VRLNWVILVCCIQFILGGLFSGITAFMLWMLGGDEPRSADLPVLDWAVYSALSVPLLSLLGILITIVIYNKHPNNYIYWFALFPLIPFFIFSAIFWLYFP